MPGIICPVVAYAPNAATKPSIAAQPLNFSASGDIIKIKYELNIKKKRLCCEFLVNYLDYKKMILYIRKVYWIDSR